MLENADRVLFNNYKLVDTAKNLGYTGKNSIVIPNGVDTDFFVPMNRERAKTDLGLPKIEHKIVGFVGNLKWVKGADRLPKIFNEIVKQHGEVQFIVIGDGKYRRSIERKCNLYKLKVKFTGRIEHDQLPLWMNAFDILVLPSRNEGFPNVCIEAQSCGCPVVGSNVGGIPEAIGDGAFMQIILDGILRRNLQGGNSFTGTASFREQIRKRPLNLIEI